MKSLSVFIFCLKSKILSPTAIVAQVVTEINSRQREVGLSDNVWFYTQPLPKIYPLDSITV
jgi:hypothetical protein